jgi:hypothetical protein
VTDTVGIRVSTRQVRELFTFSVSGALRQLLQLDAPLLQMACADIERFQQKQRLL